MKASKSKAQITKEIEEVKYKLWCFVRDNPKSTTVEISDALGATRARVHHFCNTMVDGGYLKNTRKTINKTSHSIYEVTDKEYTPDTKLIKLSEEAQAELTPLEKATRVIRLLDKPIPRPKSESKKSVSVAVGSSMSLFNSY
jgi:hypothetical protein